MAEGAWWEVDDEDAWRVEKVVFFYENEKDSL